jgi:hypothetical protein
MSCGVSSMLVCSQQAVQWTASQEFMVDWHIQKGVINSTGYNRLSVTFFSFRVKNHRNLLIGNKRFS